MTTIEVGKFYKSKFGHKIEVVRFFKCGNADAVLVIHTDKAGVSTGAWDYMDDAVKYYTPWRDEPAIPWDSVPEWLEWWAVDNGGDQWFYSEKPKPGTSSWLCGSDPDGLRYVPPARCIPYTGDWRESLRQRPGKEAK